MTEKWAIKLGNWKLGNWEIGNWKLEIEEIREIGKEENGEKAKARLGPANQNECGWRNRVPREETAIRYYLSHPELFLWRRRIISKMSMKLFGLFRVEGFLRMEQLPIF